MNIFCPICGSNRVEEFLNHNNVPVHQNMLFIKQEEAVKITRGSLSVVLCLNCGFVFNADYDNKLLSYNAEYENTQNYSSAFEKYIDNTIEFLVEQRSIKNLKVIEVGCGKGSFLRKIVERGNNVGIGFDPSYIGPLEDLDGKLRFEKSFYGENSADLAADVIICRHVIEHISDPISLLRNVRRALTKSPHAIVFFETPDVEWILKNRVIWDFFYEHCSYFSRSSAQLAFEKSGFQVDTIREIFGGQYLWVEARPVHVDRVFNPKDVDKISDLVKKFSETHERLEKTWTSRLREMKVQGNIAIWGAGAKGVTFTNLVDPNCELITCIVDLNPYKQGKYLPGTGHPIIEYRDLARRDVKSVLIMNPNYRQEIIDLLKRENLHDIEVFEFLAERFL